MEKRPVYYDQPVIDEDMCALHFKGYDDYEIEIREIDGQMRAVPLGWKRPLVLGPWKYDAQSVKPKYTKAHPGGGEE